LKIPKRYTEVENRRTDNTMTKKKQNQSDNQWHTKHYTETTD